MKGRQLASSRGSKQMWFSLKDGLAGSSQEEISIEKERKAADRLSAIEYQYRGDR
jgi:hypothetical protein